MTGLTEIHAREECMVGALLDRWAEARPDAPYLIFPDHSSWTFAFVDRMKDAIRRRGENISSFEVESEAGAHPDIREVVAIPVPSEHGEDEVMLVLATVAGRTLDPVGVLRFLEPRMASYMLPRYIRIVEELPRTPTAKIEKHRLRADGVTADTWDREAYGVTVRRGKLEISDVHG